MKNEYSMRPYFTCRDKKGVVYYEYSNQEATLEAIEEVDKVMEKLIEEVKDAKEKSQVKEVDIEQEPEELLDEDRYHNYLEYFPIEPMQEEEILKKQKHVSIESEEA